VLVAIGIMVGSFRETVLLWMTDQLRADLYLSPAVPAAADRHPKMSADIPERLSRLPGIAAVDQMRNYEISYQGMPATLGSIDANIAGRYQTRSFLPGTTAQSVFRQLLGANAVIVSEPFATFGGTFHPRARRNAITGRWRVYRSQSGGGLTSACQIKGLRVTRPSGPYPAGLPGTRARCVEAVEPSCIESSTAALQPGLIQSHRREGSPQLRPLR
jgi:hypothetical protein